MADQAQSREQAPQKSAERGVVTVGLVATPPDHPARVAERLTQELPGLLAARASAERIECSRRGLVDLVSPTLVILNASVVVSRR